MAPLLEKLRKSREAVVDIGGHRLTVRRPTDLELTGMRYQSMAEAVRGVSEYVQSWDLRELDLDPSGTDEPAPFDTLLFTDWLEDNPDLWEPLIDAVFGLVKKRREQIAQSSKNS